MVQAIGELVSSGGMGSVYRAFEPGLGREVAIKVLAEARAQDPDERGRFRREARILASLAHPGIVPVLASGESPVPWYAMPFLSNGSLAAHLDGGARRSAEETRRVMLRLADALAHVHARGIIHRDLKAENVLLDADGEAVLADFGVAIVMTSDHSRAEITSGAGTPEYMAPEIFGGTIECDGRQDLYALGVLGFRMLTGRFPFEGSARQIAAAHLTRDVPSVAAYAAGLPAGLGAAIDRCLRRDPKGRWRTAEDLRDDLAEQGNHGRPNAARRFARRMLGWFAPPAAAR
ncbi:MAG: serine/threonine-protein kinase [Gemmatimonadales bacterium]